MSKDIYVLGISMSRHDRAVCLLKNGEIVSSIAEERLDRRKRSIGHYGHSPRRIIVPPMRSINYVLKAAGISLEDVDLIVCGRSMVSCRELLLEYLPVKPERVIEPPLPSHHLAHAYSAYGTSPFEDTAVLVIDEQGHHLPDGRFEKATWFEGDGGSLKLKAAFYGSDEDLSLGMFYNAFAMLTSLSEAMAPAAGKLMGLAPFGKPHPEWPELITVDDETGDTYIPLQRLNDFFEQVGLKVRLGYEGTKPRTLEDLNRYISIHWSEPLAADLAYKAQEELERAVLQINRIFKKKTSASKLSYAGGVALNCTTNTRLLETGWTDVFVHPAATDDGNAIGLAYYGWIESLGNPRHVQKPFNALTGITYSSDVIDEALKSFGLQEFSRKVSPAEDAVERILRGEIVCWFQRGSEWGPRALGSRSILANPREKNIRDRINSTVKFREPFRPFAISTLAEYLPELVDIANVPQALGMYMLTTGQVKGAELSEVKHIDGSIRYQVVDPQLQPEYASVIRMFKERSGIGAVLNTSFNTLGEPLVESPADAVRQFLLSRADALVIGDRVIARSDVPSQQWTEARRMAFTSSHLDPLQAALGLQAAGYPDQALALLDELDFHSRDLRWDGPAAVQGYHALLMNMALRAGDKEKAHEHAEKILEWSALPADAIKAARVIAGNPLQPGDVMLGNLTTYIGSQGGGWKFINEMFAKDKPASVAEDVDNPVAYPAQ